MTKKSLKKLIQKKLEKLQKILDKCDEARVIDADDCDTWDADMLNDLTENLKDALKLLEDNCSESGLCSLLDEYTEEDDEYDEE